MRASTGLEFPVPCGGDADSRQVLGERRRAPPMARNWLALYRKGVYNARRLDMNCASDTNVVDVAVRRLCGKVDEPFMSKLIYTVRGIGFVLVDNRQEHDRWKMSPAT
jgi:hypothetical protein